MNIILGMIKWIMTIAMSLVLIVSTILLLGTNMTIKMLPSSLDELVLLPVTIKTSIIGGNVQILTPQEYPTQFEITGIVANPEEANLRVKPGDKVGVYLRKNEANSLESNASKILPVMIAYGLTLQNGEKLVDPVDVISGKAERHRRLGIYEVIPIPVLYFLLLIVLKIVRRKRRSKHSV